MVDAEAAGVVGLNQLFESGPEVQSRFVQRHQLFQLHAYSQQNRQRSSRVIKAVAVGAV
ncbi:MAG: hypothetical protein V4555_01770 [Acidobacteriota bacterium]